MKILSAKQIREADNYTIKHEPIASIDLMERAAKVLFDWFVKEYNVNCRVKIFCGIGNNGGDGLVLARLLSQKKYQVEVYIVRYSTSSSPDFQTNEKRLQQIEHMSIIDINNEKQLPPISQTDIIVDAMWGSGLSRPIEGFATHIIGHINNSGAQIVAIDIPSGLFADKHTTGTVIHASKTISFETPKLAFMFRENAQIVGEWKALSIGLDEKFIKNTKTYHEYIDKKDIQKIVKIRKQFDHKGSYGHGLIISGSRGKMGAALLATEACLRSGSGLVTSHIPECGYEIIQSALPEAMVSIDDNENYISGIPDLEKYNAIGIGPGIDVKPFTQKALLKLCNSSVTPVVFDADALNIISLNKDWIGFIPKNSILTPHPKEFERLTGKSSNDFERHQKQINFSKDHHIYLVLKGAQTAITTPEGRCYFNSTGNPGMATAGSGDVLTGIIVGLLARGYTPEESAILGVYLHGRAGDLAARKNSMEAMIAGDLINELKEAFKLIESNFN